MQPASTTIQSIILSLEATRALASHSKTSLERLRCNSDYQSPHHRREVVRLEAQLHHQRSREAQLEDTIAALRADVHVAEQLADQLIDANCMRQVTRDG